ncbi:hypothetical protein MKW94_023451 [Papaver nudicaule]|uniref:Phytocyanin domain-containing protein n=1 Tax=Papaver nudicaule TaxID=74823 RepID=A0AA41W189_PAPNU|nr:hypothetical protein [Papaver nudicaule]
MGFSSKASVFFVIALLIVSNVPSSMSVTHDVGSWSGWTMKGNPNLEDIMGDYGNYNVWVSENTFHVGDYLHFVYSPEFHNVLQVTSSDYESCNTTAPLATYATGNDYIPIMGDADHYYFICGFPGNCDSGQKVLIEVAGFYMT